MPRTFTNLALSALVAILLLLIPEMARAQGQERVSSVPDAPAVERANTIARSSRAAPRPEPAPNAVPQVPVVPSVDDARAHASAQIGAAQFACLDALFEHESNWDPAATNPSSGAYGIAQALPATKMALVGADWADNPMTQVQWGLRYIEARYGSACNAWSFWLAHNPHWY